MSSPPKAGQSTSQVELELYFVIAKFLAAGPCQGASKKLLEELEHHQLLPKRIDWEGREHFRSYDNLVSLYRHIRNDHLLKICQRIGPLLEREVKPSVGGVLSLLGAGSQSVLRTAEDVKHIKWKPEIHAVLQNQRPLKPPSNLAHPPHIMHVLDARAFSGKSRKDHILPCKSYSRLTRLTRSLGHLSAVYCLCFDRTGEFFFTGADDHLIKVWSTLNGRLICTLRGHSAEITDMAVNFENTLLAAGSCDKFIRVWCLSSMSPVAVLHSHTGMVTSLQFCPLQRMDTRYLASTGADGCVCFWKWNVSSNTFDMKPIKFVERSRAGAQMLCSSFSPGGVFLTTGSSDQVVRVYSLAGPQIEKICELESHMERVDSIQYGSECSRFITGSKDGFARVWRFERQEWKCLVIDISKTAKKCDIALPPGIEPSKPEKLRVTMVGWNADDTRVITAVSDCTLKVWDSHNGELLQTLQSHQDEVFVLEHCPTDPRILLSAGHDGQIILWDIVTGHVIKKYFNNIQGQGHGAVFDCKWAPDGQSFAATDSHGFLMYFGFGSNERYQNMPEEMFFHTDYRPLIRDGNNYVLDEQTQQPPHLMPPPFLVDIDGNPHPPGYQKLVPGREKCSEMQLVPQLGMLPNGDREVLDDVLEVVQAMEDAPPEPPPPPEPDQEENPGEAPIIDHMINRLQQEQDQRIRAAGGDPLRVSISDHGEGADEMHSPRYREGPLSPISPSVRGPRRSGEQAGVRQAQGPVPVSQRATPRDIAKLSRRVIVRELDPSIRRTTSRFLQNMTDEETKCFLMERKRRPLPSENDSSDSYNCLSKSKHKKKIRGSSQRHEERSVNRLQTRALYDTEEEEETPGGTTEELEELEDVIRLEESDHMWKSSSDGESSDYSDWVEDTGVSLQPPKRRSSRQPKRRRFSSSTEESEDGDEDKSDTEDEEGESRPNKKQSKPKMKPPAKKKSARQTKRERKQQQKKLKLLDKQNEIRELPEAFKPPEWLTEIVPRKFPYFPQIGDEVIYFRQGHELYLKAVKARKAYDCDITRNQPWHKIANLREAELVKVVGLKYEVKPPRLVCLKLAMIDTQTDKLASGRFTVKYHDMADVIDFIVLKHTYDIAKQRKWKVGDQFRSLIDDAWWFGKIEAQSPLDDLHPDSLFQCFLVHWANGEIEKMSPWDLEPLAEGRMPRNRDASLPVTERERAAMLYMPKECDWPETGREVECRRISQCFDSIMELSIGEHFLAPVDLNAFPVYGMIIAYPIDLSLIKERLENHFYRRAIAIQYDVRHIESNAVLFNVETSKIVRLAKQLTELCLRVISDTECFDIMPIYNEITKDAEFSLKPARTDRKRGRDSNQSADDDAHGTSSSRIRNQPKRRRVDVRMDPGAWRAQCLQLLDIMFDCEDSEVFRNPVDPVKYPDYYEIVNCPIDLGTIKEHMQCDEYDSPVAFCKDVRLVCNNSKMYNTNKRSRIYAMTLRLSAMFEDQIKDIISNWKTTAKTRQTNRRPQPKPKGASRSRATTSKSRLSPGQSSATTTPGSSGGSFLQAHSSGASSGLSASRPSRGLARHRAARATRRILDSEGDESDKDEDASSSRWSTLRTKNRRVTHFADEEDEEEEEEEEKEEESSHKQAEDDSDYEVSTSRSRGGRSKPTPKKHQASSKGKSTKKKMVNGNSSRYSTRCSTGSIKRKNYNRVFSDEFNDQQAVVEDDKTSDTSESEDEKPVSKRPSPPQKSRPIPLPKGKSKSRSIKSESEESEDDNGSGSESEATTRKSRTRGLRGLAASDKDSDSDASEEKHCDKSESDKHDSDSERDRSEHSKESTSDSGGNKSGSDTEEYSEAEVATRSTRSNAQRPQSGRSSGRTRPTMDDDFVYDRYSRYSTRNRGQRTVLYREESDDNEANSGDDRTNISSRGRVRKLTPRARAIFS